MTAKTALTSLAVIILVALVAVGVGQYLVSILHPNTGTISRPALQEYLEGVQLNPDAAIDWGIVDAGSTVYFANYSVRNTGNVDLTVYIETQTLPAGWVLMWQGDNTVLTPGSKIDGWLNLTVPTSATTWPAWGFYLRGA